MRAESSLGFKRLRQVIVGAHLQPDDSVDVFSARRQNQDRHAARLPQAPQDLETIDAGQHYVEYDHVVFRFQGACQPLITFMAELDSESLALQEFFEQFAEFDIVIDQQYPHGYEFTTAGPWVRPRRGALQPRSATSQSVLLPFAETGAVIRS